MIRNRRAARTSRISKVSSITPIRFESRKETSRRETNREIKKKFLKIDTDNSGFIDLGELRRELNRQGYNIDKMTAQKIIKSYDDNPDNKLEFGEYFQLQNDMDNRKMRKNIYHRVLSKKKQKGKQREKQRHRQRQRVTTKTMRKSRKRHPRR